jgi:hypothetical protein
MWRIVGGLVVLGHYCCTSYLLEDEGSKAMLSAETSKWLTQRHCHIPEDLNPRITAVRTSNLASRLTQSILMFILSNLHLVFVFHSGDPTEIVWKFLVSLMQAICPTSSILELSHQSYLGKSTNYKASHYVVFFSLLSLIFGSNHSSQHLLLAQYQYMLFLHIFHEDSRFIGYRYVF